MRAYLISIFIFVFYSFDYAQEGWYYQNPIPTSSELKYVQFVTPDTGWATGSNGTIIHTTDGGESWNLQNAEVDDVIDLFFIDNKLGWMAGAKFTGEIIWGVPVLEPALFVTRDGGKKWETQLKMDEFAGGPYPYSICFIDSLTGWISCDFNHSSYHSLIMKTTDGGQTWVKQDSVNLHIYDVCFVDYQTGWAVGGWSDFYEVTILKTEDGGENWMAQAGGVKGVLGSVFFIDANTGWAVGTDNIILKTEDGGSNWFRQSAGQNLTNCQLTSVFFTNADSGYVAGWGIFLTTKDGGQNWSVTYPAPNALSVFFIDSQTGWRFGPEGSIQKTINAGISWSNQSKSFTNDDMQNVDFVNASEGWITSYESIYHTQNGGDSWERQQVLRWQGIQDIFAVDNLNCWVVGYNWETSSAYVLNTSDGGLHWENKQANFAGSLNSVVFVDKNIGWAVGDSGIVLSTKNGGLNWVRQESGIRENLILIDFINKHQGWVSGVYGKLLNTSNGGDDWSILV